MAVKIFGECSGSSGGKYNIWAEVNENSHSVKNNTSNLTVNLKLKRNDGYEGSAYNLNKSENFAKITVNGNVKASGNLAIDTRNNAVVTLCSWTGEVSHDSSGKLTVTIGGAFTMSGTSLTGGTASGKFNCVTIPRVTPFSLNKTSVNCGDSVTLSLSPYSSDFSHKVVYTLNKARQTVSISKGTSQIALTVPEEWAEQLPSSDKGVVNFELKTYNGFELVGSVSKNIKVLIPETEAYLPSFTFSVSRNTNGVVPGNWDALIQNISMLTVAVNSFEGKYGASCSSKCIMLDGVKKYGDSAEFELTRAGQLDLKIRVTDSRGLYSEQQTVIDVDGYSLPAFVCNNIFRCDSDGKPNDNGTSVAIDFTKKYSSIRNLNAAFVKVRYRKNNETEYSPLIQLNSSPAVLTDNFENESSYEFAFQITDLLHKTPIESVRALPSGAIPFNIKKGGKGAAFGCYAETDNELTVGYDLNVKGKLKSIDLSSECIASEKIAIDYISIKRIECLNLTFIKGVLTVKEALSANNWNEILTVTVPDGLITTPLSLNSVKFARDKNLVSYINSDGVIRMASDVEFNKDEKIFILGFY